MQPLPQLVGLRPAKSGAAVAALEFYASTYDTTDYETLVLKTGTGPATTPHTSDILAPDHAGVYQVFPANLAVWEGARCVLVGGAGTDVVSTWADDGALNPLTPQPKQVAQESGTNYHIHSDDLDDGHWSKTGITVTELAAAPSGALMNKLTASLTGNEFINAAATLSIPTAQHAVVSLVVEPGDINYCEFLVKGTGEASGTNKGVFVDIVNGIISAPLFAGYILPAVYGIEKLADSRYRAWIQLETDHDGACSTYIMPSNNASTLSMTSGEYIYATKANITDTDALIGPIITTTVAASSTAVPPTHPAVNHSDSKGPYVLNFKSNGEDQDLLLLGGTAFLKIASNLLTLTDGTNTVTAAITAGDDHWAAVVFDATGLQMSLKLNAGSWNDGTYDGSFGSGTLTFGVPTAEVMRYDIDSGLADQKTQADL